MLYDLNVPWSTTQPTEELQRTVSFLSQEGYNAVALNHTITGALPSQIINPILLTQQFPVPKNTTLLRRCTLHIADPTLNHRLPELVRAYDILALRPTTEKAYLSACLTLDHHSIISLDLTQRFSFPFRPKQAMTAVNRGIFFEICYAQGTMGDSTARTNFISGALGILRATSGRGIIISSEATNLLGIRHPADVVNLLCVWGMGRDRAEEGLGVNPRAVVVNEGLKRSGFRGMIDVIEGGKQESKDDRKEAGQKNKAGKKVARNSGEPNKNKRKADEKDTTGDGTPQISKRKAKKMRLEALKASKEASREGSSASKTPTPTANASKDSGSPSTPKEKANG